MFCFRCRRGSLIDLLKMNTWVRKQNNPFFLVDRSPWPILAALQLFSLVIGTILYFHFFDVSDYAFDPMFFSALLLLGVVCFWWRDLIRESTYQGVFTTSVRKNVYIGMALFIFSEAMLFASFFWAFFSASLSPTVGIGTIWPPLGIEPIDAWGIPFYNTVILLSSGVSVTWAHYAVRANKRAEGLEALSITIALAFVFTLFQLYEYIKAPFNISDGIFGSCFYMLTGLHGLHVFVGTVFIAVCAVRYFLNHFTSNRHTGLICAIWYWHFVDVVWIFLFIFVYVWGA